MENLTKVLIAEPYDANRTGSLGDAEYMLVCQHNFPLQYNRYDDMLMQADHDRLLQRDYKHFRQACDKHLHTGEFGIGHFARTKSPQEIFAFLIDALKANPNVNWTGYRVLITVNRGNGAPVYGLELFANKSGCKVYSGDFQPNVKLRKRPTTACIR